MDVYLEEIALFKERIMNTTKSIVYTVVLYPIITVTLPCSPNFSIKALVAFIG